jgi:hypothetical protein
MHRITTGQCSSTSHDLFAFELLSGGARQSWYVSGARHEQDPRSALQRIDPTRIFEV